MLDKIFKDIKQIQGNFSEIQENKLKEYKGKISKITCQKGCGFCCNMSVKINLLEALLIYPMINKKYLDKLEEISNRIIEIYNKNEEEDFFYIYRKEIGDCLFLNQAICSIHQYRPVTCRSVLSNHPKQCCQVDFMDNISKNEMNRLLKSMDNEINSETPYIMPFIYLAEIYEERIKEISIKYFQCNISGNMILLLNLIRKNTGDNPQKIFLDAKQNNFPELLLEIS